MASAFPIKTSYKNEHFFIDFEQMILFKLKVSVISGVSNISNIVEK